MPNIFNQKNKSTALPSITESNKSPKFKFNLGSNVREIITGAEGIVTCRTQWLSNCNTYTIQQRKLIGGKKAPVLHADEPELQLIEASVIQPNQETGGPNEAPRQTNRF